MRNLDIASADKGVSAPIGNVDGCFLPVLAVCGCDVPANAHACTPRHCLSTCEYVAPAHCLSVTQCQVRNIFLQRVGRIQLKFWLCRGATPYAKPRPLILNPDNTR